VNRPPAVVSLSRSQSRCITPREFVVMFRQSKRAEVEALNTIMPSLDKTPDCRFVSRCCPYSAFVVVWRLLVLTEITVDARSATVKVEQRCINDTLRLRPRAATQLQQRRHERVQRPSLRSRPKNNFGSTLGRGGHSPEMPEMSAAPHPPKSASFCFRSAVWLSGNALASINVVALRQTRLVPGWVTVCGRVNHLGM